ncbi:choice-of-anchor X domain-containing protein [Paucibacter soli]|uniref:choice-of-anchor X domain-containing protein n=1 Tax=Paucibacter soli TaxID=3133433 RepID=UPI0030A2F02A
MTYTVLTSAIEGVSFAPATVAVEAGKTATLTVTLQPGYTSGVFDGCGAHIELASAGTAAIATAALAGNCTITGSAKKPPSVSKVSFASVNGVISTFDGTQSLSGAIVDVKPGDSIEVLLTPDRGYQLYQGIGYREDSDGLSGDCPATQVSFSVRRITPVANCSVKYKFTLLDDNQNGKPDRDEASFILHAVEVAPKAMREAMLGKTDVTYTAYLTGNQGKRKDGTVAAVNKVVARTRFLGVGSPAPNEEEYVTLYDDGTHGDSSAADGIYTATIRPTRYENRYSTLHNGMMRAVSSEIVALDSAGNELSPFNIDRLMTSEVTLMILKDTAPASDAAQKIADNVYRSRHFITIIDPTYARRDDSQWVSRLAAKYVVGTFDTVAKFNYGETYGANWAYFERAKQYAAGIGIDDAYDNSANFGLPGICGVINFGSSSLAAYPFNHETGHCWSAYMTKPELRLAYQGGHWGISSLGETIMEQGGLTLAGGMGAWKTTLVDGSYEKFSMLDLYLAGMANISEVLPFYYVNDLDYGWSLGVNSSVPDAKVSLATGVDILRVYGARTPVYAGAVKNMHLLTLVISSKPLTEAEAAVVDIVLSTHTGNGAGNRMNGDVTPPGLAYACSNRCTVSAEITGPTVQSAQAHAMGMSRPARYAPADVIIDRKNAWRQLMH